MIAVVVTAYAIHRKRCTETVKAAVSRTASSLGIFMQKSVKTPW